MHPLSFVLVAVMKPKELKTKISHAHSLILSIFLPCYLHPSLSPLCLTSLLGAVEFVAVVTEQPEMGPISLRAHLAKGWRSREWEGIVDRLAPPLPDQNPSNGMIVSKEVWEAFCLCVFQFDKLWAEDYQNKLQEQHFEPGQNYTKPSAFARSLTERAWFPARARGDKFELFVPSHVFYPTPCLQQIFPDTFPTVDEDKFGMQLFSRIGGLCQLLKIPFVLTSDQITVNMLLEALTLWASADNGIYTTSIAHMHMVGNHRTDCASERVWHAGVWASKAATQQQ